MSQPLKILVTGSTGFIGHHFVKDLCSNYEMHLLVRNKNKLVKMGIDLNRVHVIECDPQGQWLGQIADPSFDGVVHLASCFLSQHQASDIPNLIRSNIEFPTQIMEAMSEHIHWWLNMGTFWQHFEDKPHSPVNLYAATKQSFEDVAQFYAETKHFNLIHLKISDTYGNNDPRKKLFALWKKQLSEKQPLSMSPGEQQINILHVKDVIKGIDRSIQLMSESEQGTYCGKSYALTAKQVLSLKQLAEVFEKVAGKPLNIQWGGRPYRPREVMKTWSNFEMLPGWSQEMEISEGISRFLED